MKTTLVLKPLVFAMVLALTACGGGDDDTASVDGDTASKTLSGTAAAGAPIIGQVTVKGVMGNTKSATIEADGQYTIDVTGLTAPYRLRAVGTVGGRTYKLHSYAEEADLGGNVNITPFTDLIVANAAQQIAETFFDSASDTSLDPAVVDAQEAALQAKLQDVFDVLGVSAAIDLLNSSFSADHSGLDAALDIIDIEVDTSSNIATITNLIENTSITDDVLDTGDNTESLVVSDPVALIEAVDDNQAIAMALESFSSLFTGGLPTSQEIEGYFGDNFLSNDVSKSQFLTEITTDPMLVDLAFTGVSIQDLDPVLGTAKVYFNVVIGGEIDRDTEAWYVAKDATLGWQFLGDQRIVDVEILGFHCNDYDGTDAQPGACGINTQFWDEDFTNNGTGGLPIASGTASIIDGTDGYTVKGIVYLGTPENSAPGSIQIYDEGNQTYTGDWKAFGSDLGQIDPAIFAVGDIVEYNLYTQNLDLSTPTSPQVAIGSEIATYRNTLTDEPITTGLYPTATPETITAIQNFALGDNLTIAWTLENGTVSDEVLVEISDDMGNRLEVWDETIASTATSTTIASTSLDSAAASAAGLDPDAVSYDLVVRVYAVDESTGQQYSTDYRATIDGPGATPDDSVSTLTCGYESGWDDTVDGGLGAPINPNSFAEYEGVVVDCGALAFTASDVVGNYVDLDGETFTFTDSAGAGTEADPKTGTYSDGSMTIDYVWYVEAATCTGCTHNYLVVYSDSSIDADLASMGISFRETSALSSVNGSSYSFVKYSEQSNYGDMVRETGSDGEIWNQTVNKQ